MGMFPLVTDAYVSPPISMSGVDVSITVRLDATVKDRDLSIP
jgi:hypothetical protein